MFREDEPGQAKKFSSGTKPVIAPSYDLLAPEESGTSGAVETMIVLVSGVTLFVKNLSFGTMTDWLVMTFRNLASFLSRVYRPSRIRNGLEIRSVWDTGYWL